MSKLLIIGFSAFAVVGVAGLSPSWMTGKAQDSQEGTPVRIERVTRGPLVELVQAPGEITPLKKVSISARVAARISELPFSEGDSVKSGDVLVKLESTDLEASLRSVESRFAAQRAQLDVERSHIEAQKSQIAAVAAAQLEAQRDLARQKRLVDSQAVSQTALDQAQRRFDEQSALCAAAGQTLASMERNLVVLQHNMDAAEAEIAVARDNLSYTTIASPISGIITKLNAKPGELVVTGTLNTPGTVILEVADFSEMLLAARVDESSIASVKVGQKARIHTQAYGDRIFPGVVRSVAPAQASPAGSGAAAAGFSNSRYFKVEILLDAGGERIFSGLSADVEIETQAHPDVLKIPSQAVLSRSTDELPATLRDDDPLVKSASAQTAVVYRVINGKAVVTPVQIGPSDLSCTIITGGLSPSDEVITGPYKTLEKIAQNDKVKSDRPRQSTSRRPSQTNIGALALKPR